MFGVIIILVNMSLWTKKEQLNFNLHFKTTSRYPTFVEVYQIQIDR